jgi:tetratricopeptide (TPR) repeat protein
MATTWTHAKSSSISITTLRSKASVRRISDFRNRFGEGHFYLACHAALPIALTPDLLYCLWANFQQDCHGTPLNIPWIAVADLILSPLCEEVGYALYEMDVTVQQELMRSLQNNSHLGQTRVKELANFVLTYIARQKQSLDSDLQDFAQAQQWRIAAYTKPAVAVQEIASALANLSLTDKADKIEWIRMAALLETLTVALADYSSLLIYAAAMADFFRGKDSEAAARLRGLLGSTNQIQVAGIDLPVPIDIVMTHRDRIPSSVTPLDNLPDSSTLGDLPGSSDSPPLPSTHSPNDSKTAENFYQQAVYQHNRSNYAGVFDNANKAIKLNSDYAYIRKVWGIVRSAKGNHKKAIKNYTQAIALSPNDADVYNNRGASYADMEDHKKAVEDYTQAITLRPHFATAYYNRGLSHAELGNYQEVIEDFNQAIKLKLDLNQSINLKPYFATAYYYRGLSRAELGDYQGAIEDYTQAISLKPNYAAVYAVRGGVRANLGDQQGMIEDYTQLISLQPCSEIAYYIRGSAYADICDHQNAVEDYSQAIKLDPNYVAAYLSRGTTYANLGDKQKALSDLEKAAKLFKEQRQNQNYQETLNRIRELQ